MKQVYFSEKLNKYYGSQKECEAAEKEYDLKQEEISQIKIERSKEADEIKVAEKAYKEAYDHYLDLLNKFIKKYKTYHYSYTTEVQKPTDLFDIVFRSWPF